MDTIDKEKPFMENIVICLMTRHFAKTIENVYECQDDFVKDVL